MNDRISKIAMLAVVTGFVGVAFGLMPKETTQATSQETLHASTIVLGDNINDALKILGDHNVLCGRGAVSFARGPEDEDYFTANIDPAHMVLFLWYSKTNQDIIRMQVLVSPWPARGKLSEIRLPVTSYRLNEDGTFALSFPKPPTIAEIEERRKNMIEKIEKAEIPKPTFGKSKSER